MYERGDNVGKLTFSCLNRLRILISLKVRWQYVWCSKGRIFLIATFFLVLLSSAELWCYIAFEFVFTQTTLATRPPATSACRRVCHDCLYIIHSPNHAVSSLSNVRQSRIARTDVKSLASHYIRWRFPCHYSY